MDSAERQLPKYRSHKEVWALKLVGVATHSDGSATLVPEDNRYATFVIDSGWAERFHGSKDDYGYYVVYSDGYTSWSPTKAFEEGYTKL